MASFRKGDLVKLNIVAPQGPILAMRMTEDGDVQCLVEWTDENNEVQQRWFNEGLLLAVE